MLCERVVGKEFNTHTFSQNSFELRTERNAREKEQRKKNTPINNKTKRQRDSVCVYVPVFKIYLKTTTKVFNKIARAKNH